LLCIIVGHNLCDEGLSRRRGKDSLGDILMDGARLNRGSPIDDSCLSYGLVGRDSSSGGKGQRDGLTIDLVNSGRLLNDGFELCRLVDGSCRKRRGKKA
jgi:hypothetical protein